MKRLLLIFLLAILPLQASWAAVAAYCQHEQEQAAQHLGHHAHQHTATDADQKDDPGKTKTGLDNDCALCHLSQVAATFNALPYLPVVVDRLLPVAFPRHYISPSPTGIDKPNWHPVA